MKTAKYYVNHTDWTAAQARQVGKALISLADGLDTPAIDASDVFIGAVFFCGEDLRRIAHFGNNWLAIDNDMNICGLYEGPASRAAAYFANECGYTKEPRS